MEAEFDCAIKKYIQQKEKEGQVIEEADAIFYVLIKTKLGQKVQVAATFPFIALYDDLALTPKDILAAHAGNNPCNLVQIVDILPDHEDDCWKLHRIATTFSRTTLPTVTTRSSLPRSASLRLLQSTKYVCPLIRVK